MNQIQHTPVQSYTEPDSGVYIRPVVEPVAEVTAVTADEPIPESAALSNPVFGLDFKEKMNLASAVVEPDTMLSTITDIENTLEALTPTETPEVIEVTEPVVEAPEASAFEGVDEVVIAVSPVQALSEEFKDVATQAEPAADPQDAWRHAPVHNAPRQQKHKKHTGANTERLLDFNEERAKRIQQTPKAQVPVVKRPAALLQSATGAALIEKFLAGRVQNDEEGESHINLDLESKFEWARALTLNAHTPFDHPSLGRFSSIGGLWNYLVYDADDNYRALSGSQVGNYRNNQQNRRENQIDGFLLVVAEAVWIKIQNYGNLRKALVDNRLPFRMYRPEGQAGLRVNNKLANWYPAVIEEIARTLQAQENGQEDAFPDFSHLNTLHPRSEERPRFGQRRDQRR